MSEQSIRDAWLWQASTCDAMGAPFTAAVLRCMVEDSEAKSAIAPLLDPYDDPSARALLMAALPLRILGGLHFLVLTGAAPDLARRYASGETEGIGGLVADTAREHFDTLARFMISPPQTNEVRRSLCLVGGFLEAAQATELPLRCLELGASAGLNMNWDRYAYDFGGGRRWGPPDAALTLSGDWTGGLPPLDAELNVVEKRACDQSPIDVRSDEGALLLQAYLWPEQKDRLDRIRTAIQVARLGGIEVEKADAADWVRSEAGPKDGVATVIYHSIFLQYPPEDVRASIVAGIRAHGELAKNTSPLAWLRMEPKAKTPVEIEVRLTVWPGGDDRHLADVHPHGASVQWGARSDALGA